METFIWFIVNTLDSRYQHRKQECKKNYLEKKKDFKALFAQYCSLTGKKEDKQLQLKGPIVCNRWAETHCGDESTSMDQYWQMPLSDQLYGLWGAGPATVKSVT